MRYFIPVLVLGCVFSLIACAESPEQPQAEPPERSPGRDATVPETRSEHIGYAIGHNIATNLAGQGFYLTAYDADIEFVLAGIRDQLTDQPSQLDPAAMQQAIRDYQALARERRRADREAVAMFLIEHARRDGVLRTEGGLQYEAVEEGDDRRAGPTDSVRLHYRGTLVDGTVFADTYEAGQPVTIDLQQTIPGWRAAAAVMNAGGRYRIVMPPNLAYGPRGNPPSIPADAALVFDVQLLEILESD